jgi:hypothetical protein
MDVLILAAVVWWTFAVVILMTVVNASDIDNIKDLAISIGLAVFWPLTAVMVVPFIIYQAAVASTSRIRVDLKNRGVLREFEAWLRERNAGKILPKDE